MSLIISVSMVAAFYLAQIGQLLYNVPCNRMFRVVKKG